MHIIKSKMVPIVMSQPMYLKILFVKWTFGLLYSTCAIISACAIISTCAITVYQYVPLSTFVMKISIFQHANISTCEYFDICHYVVHDCGNCITKNYWHACRFLKPYSGLIMT